MGMRSLAMGLMFTTALFFLAACQGASTEPPDPATATFSPTAAALPIPTHTPVPTDTSLPPTTPPIHTPTYTPAPTSMPTSTSTPIPTPAPTSRPTLARTPTPTVIPTPTSQRQAQNPIFYKQNGLTLEYYWPLDDRSHLSADETEILAYNESDQAIEFKLPEMTFTENGSPRAQFSGNWEKFPSRYSWDRIEYISIPPSPYRGEPLLVLPGEKAKIHWHLERMSTIDTNQSVTLDLTVTTGGGTETITYTLVRGSQHSNTGAATAPEPTQAPHESQQSTSNDVHADSADTTSGVQWWSREMTWSPNGTPPDCPEPFVVQTPVDINMVVAALWPGQVRGGYVPHGGFRFDSNDRHDITVQAPIDSYLVQGSQYLANGDKQYLLSFSVPCGF